MLIARHPITNNYHRGVPCYNTFTLHKPMSVSIATIHFPDVGHRPPFELRHWPLYNLTSAQDLKDLILNANPRNFYLNLPDDPTMSVRVHLSTRMLVYSFEYKSVSCYNWVMTYLVSYSVWWGQEVECVSIIPKSHVSWLDAFYEHKMSSWWSMPLIRIVGTKTLMVLIRVVW